MYAAVTCSRVMPRSSAAYGAIGVSLILCANVVIIQTCLVSGCKDRQNNPLDGRRLDGQPTAKGLYIHGGKKVAIK